MQILKRNDTPNAHPPSECRVCCKDCGRIEYWNKAVEEGWCFDLEGRAFKDYYCAVCAGKVFHCLRDVEDA